MNHSSVHLPLSKQSYRMHIKIDEHLVEGGVGVEEDEDPLSDDLALNAKVVLCSCAIMVQMCSLNKNHLDEVSELSAIHLLLFSKHDLKHLSNLAKLANLQKVHKVQVPSPSPNLPQMHIR